MSKENTRELVRAFAPRLQSEFQIDPVTPLDIRISLERLRLTELLEDVQRAQKEADTEGPQPNGEKLR